jgi:hypothetical protein
MVATTQCDAAPTMTPNVVVNGPSMSPYEVAGGGIMQYNWLRHAMLCMLQLIVSTANKLRPVLGACAMCWQHARSTGGLHQALSTATRHPVLAPATQYCHPAPSTGTRHPVLECPPPLAHSWMSRHLL